DRVCDAAPTLTALGSKVAALDAAPGGTTVQQILDAADSLIASGDETIVAHGVTLGRGDLTCILGLIWRHAHVGWPAASTPTATRLRGDSLSPRQHDVRCLLRRYVFGAREAERRKVDAREQVLSGTQKNRGY